MAAADHPFISSSPPPTPTPPEPLFKNPWRITPCPAAPAPTALTLIGEPPSSWPALTSNPSPKLESPDHPPHHHTPSPPPAAADSPNTTPDLFSSSASSSSDPSSHDDAVAVTVAAAAAVSPAVPPPAPAPVLPVSPRNADQPRISASHHRRGRNPRFQNHRGGGGGGGGNGSPRSNNSYGNRALAPGWRPNWGGFTPVPQYPNWGFFPGSAVGVGVVPPADYFVPYPQPFNEMVYPDYGMGVEPYGAYYGQPAYEVQYAPQMNPAVAGIPSPPGMGFPVDHELEALKTRLIFQIEYYFSDENLAKDTFLRNQMDNQGWVDILAITPFKRVVALVDEFKKKDALVEAVSLIKDTLQTSNVVEFQGNKMRKRIGWHKWIMRETTSPKQLVTGMRSIKLGREPPPLSGDRSPSPAAGFSAMRSSTQKDLSVYDFDEHEESVEELSGKNKSRFDPKRQKTGSEIDKYTFIQSFTSRLSLDSKDVAEVTCIDLSEKDNTPVSSHAVDSEEENPMLFEEKSESDEVIASSSNSHEHSQMSQDESEPDTLTGAYPLVMGASGLMVSSVGNEQFAGPPSDETFVDVTSVDGESLEYESGSPSTSASDLSENEGLLVDSPFYHPAFEDAYDDDMAVIVSPDYMLYGKTLYLESLFTFSSDCIIMECFDASGNFEKLVLEWRLADIIHIACWWCTSAEVATVEVCLSTAAVDETKRVNAYPDTVKLRFSVTGILWLDKERKIHSLAPRYKDVWIAHSSDNSASEGDIREDNMFISKHYFTEIGEPFEDVIYPKGDPDAVSISKRDIELLQPDTFINDTIVDFYMKYLKNKIPPGEKHRFHFFNSFFFRKLADLDKDPGSALQGRAAFLRVRKWTRKVNLFDKDYIFIPVNYNLHWSLLVICRPGHIDNVQDDVKESPEVPCILHMDSIKGNHSGLRTLIQSYLMEEWKERHQGSNEGILSKFSNLRYIELELPQQENSFDCGLFLLHYAELFLEEAPANFCPLKISKFRPFLTANWFVPAEASLKRTIIRRLIYDLLKSPSLLFSGYPGTDDKKEPAVQCCYEAKQEFSDSAHFVSDSRIEIKLLATTASGVVQCDKGLVLREFFEPRAAAESSSDYSDHPFQLNVPQKLNALRCPIEESANLSEKLVFTGLDKVDGRTVDAKQSEQICVTSYSAEGVDMETMQEREELASDSLPGLLNSVQMASIEKDITDFLPESCGFVPDSPITPFGEKMESCVADFQKNNAVDISKLDPGVHPDSHLMNSTEPEVVKNEYCEDVEGARGEEDGQNMDCIMANSENCPGTNTTDATSEKCKRTNTSDGGQCQETGTSNGNCVPCVSGQSWQEIISSDEESAVDKDESGPQLKRRKLTAHEGGRRHTRSSARKLLP